jgi:hypothetical protein
LADKPSILVREKAPTALRIEASKKQTPVQIRIYLLIFVRGGVWNCE